MAGTLAWCLSALSFLSSDGEPPSIQCMCCRAKQSQEWPMHFGGPGIRRPGAHCMTSSSLCK